MKKKAHKTRRQLQAEKVAAATKLTEKANASTNPLESFDKFHKYTPKDGSIVELSTNRVTTLPLETIDWIYDLMERNMKKLYEESSWGWDGEKKRMELTEDAAWYLIASSEGKKIGFSHFRFDLDDGVPVLYCYELQLEPLERRKGLGRFMMQALEAIAAKSQMQKVVLTVLNRNPIALSFFCKLGYKLDRTNLPPTEDIDYMIFSKQNLQHS